MTVCRVRPEPLSHLTKAPLQPAIPGQIVLNDGTRGAVKEGQELVAMPLLQVLLGELIPILGLRKPELLAQPVEIAAPIGPLLPKPQRHVAQAPFLPRVVRPVILEERERGSAEVIQDPAPTPLQQHFLRQLIPVFQDLNPELLP